MINSLTIQWESVNLLKLIGEMQLIYSYPTAMK